MIFREKQQIVICIVAVAMVGGFVLFRYLPLQKKMKQIEQAKNTHITAIAEASRQRDQLPEMRTKVLELQKAVSNYHKQIPEQSGLGAFLHQIADLMNEHNLTEQVVTPESQIPSDELNCIPVTLQCKGKLAQIFEFYKQLRKLDRLVRLQEVKLSNDGDYSGEISMQTKTVIYCKPQVTQG